jgi:hypothetical protein
MVDEFGFVNVDKLCEQFERLELARSLAEERYRYLHWELEYSDLFDERGGFDLLLGNPPWIKVEWEGSAVIGDRDPSIVLRKLDASATFAVSADRIKKREFRSLYFEAYENASSLQSFMISHQNFPAIQGAQSNLYKCFLPVAWLFRSKNGVCGFLHPEGVFDDPKGGMLRPNLYKRIRYHFQFQNGLNLFPIAHRARFSINVYGAAGEPNFVSIANLFTPVTVDACIDRASHGLVGGIKNSNGDWNTRGHGDRVIRVGESELSLFADVFDKPDTPALEAKFPAMELQRKSGHFV